MSLQTHSSLTAALKSASSAAESFQSGGGEGGGSELKGAEEEDEQLSHVNENGWQRGEDGRTVNGSKRQHIHGEISDLGLLTQMSIMGSVSMEDLTEGDEAASSSDCQTFEASELQLIEVALRSLQSVGEGKTEASKDAEQNFSSSSDLQDVGRLLKKVQAVKNRNEGVPLKHVSPDRSLGQGPPGGEILESADIRQVAQAAAQTALAAAKTAETVVSSLNRNSQAMEELCKALTGSNSLQAPSEETVKGQEEDEEQERKLLSIELQQTEIAKSLVRQNRVTHWVLGFIVVSSLVWRYGVVKFVKRVNNTIQNPFQGITNMFKSKDGDSDEDNSGLPFKLPGILGGEGEAKEVKGQPETEKEDNKFDFGKIFQIQERMDMEGRPFNFGNMANSLPGHDRAASDDV